MKKRKFKDYQAYKAKQIEKTSKPSLKSFLERESEGHTEKFRTAFLASGLLDLIPPTDASGILCLGARFGEEVIALRRLGYKQSIGVDLCRLSECVIAADFHQLPFPDNQFDGIYSNAVDHCFDLKQLISEADRVLKPDGVILLHLGVRVGMGGYESVSIESVEDITKVLPNYETLHSVQKKSLSILDRGGGLNHELALRKPC